jgi:hypothetical protein
MTSTSSLVRAVARIAAVTATAAVVTFAWRAFEAIRIVGGTGALPATRRRLRAVVDPGVPAPAAPRSSAPLTSAVDVPEQRRRQPVGGAVGG